MTDGLKPYPACKPSGVEYLVDVPVHWEVLPLKRIGMFRSGAGFPISEQGCHNESILFVKVSDMNRVGNEKFIYCSANTMEIKQFKKHGTHGEDAPPLIRRIHKRLTAADPLRGLVETTVADKTAVVEYEPDGDLRDTEQIPLQEEGGIDAFLEREVLPWAPDAWYRGDSVKIGYEISFNRYFYKPQPMRPLDEICADIRVVEGETEGLLDEIVGGRKP